MIMGIRIAAFFIFCFCGFSVFAQHMEKYNELTRLKIADKDICPILDSIVSHEKECEYYSDSLMFSIHIRNSENKFFISIESIMDSNIVQGLNPYGYFYFKDHLMFVDGETCQELFLKTKETKLFQYIDYDPAYQEKEEVIQVYTDDSYSQWLYWYINGKLTLEDKSSSCK